MNVSGVRWRCWRTVGCVRIAIISFSVRSVMRVGRSLRVYTRIRIRTIMF